MLSLAGRGAKAFEWFHDGIRHIRDLPDDVSLTAKQTIQVRAVRSKRPHVDTQALRTFLDGLQYPLYFLDFETINPSIPMWDKTSPYQQVPFQFSLHVVRKPSAKPEHHAFLADKPTDARKEILTLLKRHIGPRGSILAYFARFEKDALQASSQAYPAFASWWRRIEPRVVDLLQPFRSFHYYHPDQCGSASLKSVLPALTGKGYDALEIGDGGTASTEFARITFGDVSAAERKRVRAALEKYCALDTEGMTTIIRELGRLASSDE